MPIEKPSRLGMRLSSLAFVALLFAAAGLLGYLAHAYPRQWDITQNTRNSLSAASVTILRQMPGPLTVTAYANEHDPRLGDVRKLIRDFIALYQRAKPDLTLKIVDPTREPQATRAAGIQVNGEMVVAYRGRIEHLTTLNEQALTNLLMRLARSSERQVMYLDGHGERKLDGIANYDLGEFGKQLQSKGFKPVGLNLAIAQAVPVNASLLIITQPQVDVLPGELDKLKAYMERGGNILWLIDPEPLHGLQPLAEQLGLVLTPGTVIDPAAQQMKAPPTWALATAYAQHPALRAFDLTTVFPFARQITTSDNKDYRVTPLIEVAQRGWVETGTLDGTAAFDKAHDAAGPVTIAIALERQRDEKNQRIVVIGNGNFLANAYLGNGGNLDLGVNLINWLVGDENLVTIQPKASIDANLDLKKPVAVSIVLGFLVVLPLAFLLIAALIWWRRRKL